MGNYLSEPWSVSNTSSKIYSVAKDLGHVATFGYIVCDGGTVHVQVSENRNPESEMKVQLDKNDSLMFEKIQGWRISRLKISTDSATAISGRLFLR